MKWLLVIALSLLLVTVCVVYFRYGMHPLKPEIVKTPIAQPLKPKRIHAPKPSPKGPVDISGPLKDRELVSWILPTYPDWAQVQGITGTMRMKIWVTPAGDVKSFMQPEQLSADPRLDEKAVEALREWKFAEKPNAFGDQWGVITIRFSLLAQEEATPEATLHGIALGGSTASGAWRCVKEWIGHEYRYYCKLVRPHLSN